jgi:hypothetical protein
LFLRKILSRYNNFPTRHLLQIIEKPIKPAAPQPSNDIDIARRAFTARKSTRHCFKVSYLVELLEKAQSGALNGGKQTMQIKSAKQVAAPLQSKVQLGQRLPKSVEMQINLSGPCGDPITDLLNGHVRRGKHEFDQPIDLQEMNEDFDFCGNLALFQKATTSVID